MPAKVIRLLLTAAVTKEERVMKATFLRAGLPVAMALVVAGSLATTPVVGAESSRSLEGTWRVQVTLKDCTTGAPRPPFWSLLTFARGGTLTETTNNPAFQPGQRSSGHGTWRRKGHGYEAATEAFIQFSSAPPPPAPSFQRGLQRISQAIEIQDDPDVFTSVASVLFFDAVGNPLATGCATAVGYRAE